MKWIIKFTGKHLWAVMLLCVLTVALTLAGVVQALAMAKFLDFAAAGDKAGFLRWFGGGWQGTGGGYRRNHKSQLRV